jgi:hypothetical protein
MPEAASWSAFACDIAPSQDPSRFRSLTLPSELLLPAASPRLTHTMPCCAAKIDKLINVESLSPLWQAEHVKPAANLSIHPNLSQIGELASMNAFIGAAGPPM